MASMSMDRIIKDLQCSSCNAPMAPPIYLCQRHHDVCEPCKNRYTDCPRCGTSITNRRDYNLEEATGYVTYACKNDGCRYTCNGLDLRHHENHCDRRKFECPLAIDCDWYDSSGEFEEHARECHFVSANVLANDEYKLMALQSYAHVALFKCNGGRPIFFVVHVRNDAEESLVFRVQFVGDWSIGGRYRYKLKLRDSDDMQRMSFVRRCPLTADRCSATSEQVDGEDPPDAVVRIPLQFVDYLRADVCAIKFFHD